MDSKHLNLLHLMITEDQVTAAVLAQKFSVSTRSIKQYIKDINYVYPETIKSSNKGYTVDSEKAIQIIKENQNSIPQTPRERCSYLIVKLINQKNSDLNEFDLSEELFISLSTLRKDLEKIKRKLAKFDLQLVIKKGNLSLNGSEKNKRKLLSATIYDETNLNFLSFQTIQSKFHNLDIISIKNIILEQFTKFKYYINDYSLSNLVLHIAITIERIKSHNLTSPISDISLDNKAVEIQLAEAIASPLQNQYNIVFNNSELLEMSQLILSRATTINEKDLDISEIKKKVGYDCFNFVQKIIHRIQEMYFVDLEEPDFMIRFSLHIKNLIERSKHNYFNKNPLANDIKKRCPLIYDMSVSIAALIKEYYHIDLNNDEIAYIAFHIGSSIESQQELKQKLNTILFCPDYYNTKNKLAEKIIENFHSDIVLLNIITDESQLVEYQNIDLIISTVPYLSTTTEPITTALISIFYTNRDKEVLLTAIKEQKRQKQQKLFEYHLKQITSEQLFLTTTKITDRKTCLKEMATKLEALKYTNSHFIQEIIEREKLSSTAFGLFAIPHSMKMTAKKTGLNILINNQGIDWENTSVQLVIMMCFNTNERQVFNEVYDPLTQILSDNNNLAKILAAKDYNDFINILVNCF